MAYDPTLDWAPLVVNPRRAAMISAERAGVSLSLILETSPLPDRSGEQTFSRGRPATTDDPAPTDDTAPTL